LEKVGDTFLCRPLNIASDIGSHHIVGSSPRTSPETLQWLHDPQGTAFCFPPKEVGPDVIFNLRLLNSEKILRVIVQFKHRKSLSLTETQDGISTTDPYRFLSQKTARNAKMRVQMREAITNLGDGTDLAGECGVLRVLVSHPASPVPSALNAASNESHEHPVATVNIKHLATQGSLSGQMILSLGSERVIGQAPTNGKREQC
jgi:hypothetical protein